MKEYIQYAFLIFITISLINCSGNKNEHPKTYIDNKTYVDVVIENKTQDKFYTGKLAGHSFHCGENEKIYSLVERIDWDTSSISMDCYDPYYIYDVEIPANDIIIIKMGTSFEINNDKYSIEINEQNRYKEIHENNYYNDDNIKFLIYYTKEIMNVTYYSNYVKAIKENGYSLYGYYKNGIIHFLIE